MSNTTIDQMMQEFCGSFLSYVRPDADDRKVMLPQMLAILPKQLMEFMQVHDLAALLSACVYVDPKAPEARSIVTAQKQSLVREEEQLISAYTVDANYETLVSTLFERLVATDEGRQYLQSLLVCLILAHQEEDPKVTVNLWQP